MEMRFPLLREDQIEVRINQTVQRGAIALLYKTARTDMDILDEVVGPMNWGRCQVEIKGNLYCVISIWDEGKKDWVKKSDCGVESRSDGSGNEKKGEASDAFKRAGINWGIGRELYTAPFIFLKVETEQDGRGYKLKDKYEQFSVAEIGYDERRRINKLVITGKEGRVVYSFGKENLASDSIKSNITKSKNGQNNTVIQQEPWSFMAALSEFEKKHSMTREQFLAWRKAAIDGGIAEDIPAKSMTKEQADKLFEIIEVNFLAA